jgi:N-acetyltransferase 10
MGYGSRALKALESFYNGEYFNLDEAPEEAEQDDYRPVIDTVRMYAP